MALLSQRQGLSVGTCMVMDEHRRTCILGLSLTAMQQDRVNWYDYCHSSLDQSAGNLGLPGAAHLHSLARWPGIPQL